MKLPIQYHQEIYLGESIENENLDKLKAKINAKKTRVSNKLTWSDFYLIALASNPNDQLDIMNVKQLEQSYYHNHPVYAVGIAADYDEALLLVEKIVKECLQTRGDVSLKEFLQCPQQS